MPGATGSSSSDPNPDDRDPRFLHFALLGPEWRIDCERPDHSGATVDSGLRSIDIPQLVLPTS